MEDPVDLKINEIYCGGPCISENKYHLSYNKLPNILEDHVRMSDLRSCRKNKCLPRGWVELSDNTAIVQTNKYSGNSYMQYAICTVKIFILREAAKKKVLFLVD